VILDTIVAHKKEEVKTQQKQLPLSELEQTLRDTPPTHDFKMAISTPGQINLIAEVKKASPSKGIIRKDFDPTAIAQAYQSSSVAAISVLTDERFFQGRLPYLTAIRETTSIPLLRKDFIIDEYQIYQSRAAGADTILLIAAILDLKTMQTFLNIAHNLDLDCLVEVHTESELKKILNTDARIVGINNRDLRTFETNLGTTVQLRKLIPQDKVVVSESGIHSRQDVRMLQECGINAILVGEALMKSADINAKIKELMEG
jgi:indole-3-glycerol phosphate synthase